MDIGFEWIIPYRPSRNQLLLKAVLWSATLVFLVDAIFFAAAMLFVALACGIALFIFTFRLRYEYEYEYINGDLTVTKIIRKSKRKEVFHAMRTEISRMQPGRKGSGGKKVLDLTSNRPGKLVCTVEAGGKELWIEAVPEFLEEMKRYYPELSALDTAR